ncbi:hypothetical protein RRG08_000467 [Elysia crispata]|uniref:Uncharacterized protein n=1 Tax=Elysia crispata TaxID=231223 RepID=A0AAE0YD52_9GAST|nr:hypothetical protein RRG08_000467 [Elysia crispata]
MSSYFVNSLSACYGPGSVGLDPCSDGISAYDAGGSHYLSHHHLNQQHAHHQQAHPLQQHPQHHHQQHQQQHHHHHQQHSPSNIYSPPSMYGDARYYSQHHNNHHHQHHTHLHSHHPLHNGSSSNSSNHRLTPEARYGDPSTAAAVDYYSTLPRLSHLPPRSPTPPLVHTGNLGTPSSPPLSSSSSSPPAKGILAHQPNHRKLTAGGDIVNNNNNNNNTPPSSTLENLSPNSRGATSIPNSNISTSKTGTRNGNSCSNDSSNSFYSNNFLDADSKAGCESPPLGQRQKPPQTAHLQNTPQASSPPSSPPSATTATSQKPHQQGRQADIKSSGSPGSQGDQSSGPFPAPQIYPWMRRMQYSAGMPRYNIA